MINAKDFTISKEIENSPAISGTSEKVWIEDYLSKAIGLFKYSKNEKTSEHISESIAYYIAKKLKLDCVAYEIGYRNGRIGCYCETFLEDDESFATGLDFITEAYPEFNSNSLYDDASGLYYSVELIFTSLEKVFKDDYETINYLKSRFLLTMVFDMVIGNSDRGVNDWGVIINQKTQDARVAPLFDNGSSLCWDIDEDIIDLYLENKNGIFDELVEKKSFSKIRVEGKNNKYPTQKELMVFLDQEFPAFKDAAELIVKNISAEWLEGFLSIYSGNLLSKKRKMLIIKYLRKNLEILKEIINE